MKCKKINRECGEVRKPPQQRGKTNDINNGKKLQIFFLKNPNTLLKRMVLRGSACSALMLKAYTLKTVILTSSSNLKPRLVLSSWSLLTTLKNFLGNQWTCLLWVGFKGFGFHMLPNQSRIVLSMSNRTDSASFSNPKHHVRIGASCRA